MTSLLGHLLEYGMLSSRGRPSISARLAGRSPQFVNHHVVHNPRALVLKILFCSIATIALVSCGGPGVTTDNNDPTATAIINVTVEASPASPQPKRTACSDGRLLVGDLPAMDDKWQDGIQNATDKATAWQSDAKLATLRVGCELLEPGFRWQATFYSPSSQAYFKSDTGQIDAAEDDPNTVPILSTSGLSFGLLRKSLNAEGYDDSTELNPSTGVELKPSTPTAKFGPPESPDDATLFHVAIEFRGEVKDLFVDVKDGKVYRYHFD